MSTSGTITTSDKWFIEFMNTIEFDTTKIVNEVRQATNEHYADYIKACFNKLQYSDLYIGEVFKMVSIIGPVQSKHCLKFSEMWNLITEAWG